MPCNDKQSILKFAASQEDKIVLARAYDCVSFVEKTGKSKELGFESPALCEAVKMAFRAEKNVSLALFGGYDEAERKAFCFYPKGDEPQFSLCCLELSGDFSGLCHRDFLGSIMSLGIVRENVGDICIFDNKCYVFALFKMADYIVENLTSVSHSAVSAKLFSCSEVKIERQFDELKKSIASPRADAVIAAMFNLSRGDAEELIRRKNVMLNYAELKDGDKHIGVGDTISARGLGKAIVTGFGEQTRKGRIFINIKKYK